ncbi:MAG: hypothetical protein M3Q07_07720, partial [Pseudobdellovibrionaceae bacterium]|nr:hypothetical protein [Pseudobdellovibrionaceae bacterium]
ELPGASTPLPEPGATAFSLEALRGIELTGTRGFVYGISLDAPVNIGIIARPAEGSPDLQVWYSEFLNNTPRFKNQSYVVHASGGRADFRFSSVHDHDGLIQYGSGKAKVDFQVFEADSFIRNRSHLIMNSELGTTGPIDCSVDAASARCYLQL